MASLPFTFEKRINIFLLIHHDCHEYDQIRRWSHPPSGIYLEQGLTCLFVQTLPSSLAEFLLAQNINIYDIKISILYKLYETQFGFIMIS